MLLVVLAGLTYGIGIAFSLLRLLPGAFDTFQPLTRLFVWYSGAPFVFGVLLAAIDLFVLLPHKRRWGSVQRDALPLESTQNITVVLTAYNDEDSIAAAVADFREQPQVAEVVVVENNSRDATASRAEAAGARVVTELNPGYGNCVYRCLQEGLSSGADLILLCEGDLTFSASDISKFLAYMPHAGIVNGTRIVEQLRDYSTQLTTFMYYGNFFVGKLLEFKHIGQGTFTDVGTTYKMMRRESLLRLMPHLDPQVNLEFNAHFLDRALMIGERLVECPVTFHPRVGESKGGNVNNRRALLVGSRMILGILLGWTSLRTPASPQPQTAR